METILNAKIELLDFCIERITESLALSAHIEAYSEAYYEIEAVIRRLKEKRQEFVEQLENNQ
jgi:hypothetical protein